MLFIFNTQLKKADSQSPQTPTPGRTSRACIPLAAVSVTHAPFLLFPCATRRVFARSSSAAESGARDVILLERRLLGTGGKWAQICEVRGTLSDTCNMFWMVTMGTAGF